MGYNTSMRFKGEVRWLEPEEQALYREAKKCLNERYQRYSREVKRLRKSWMAIDHLTADSIQQAGWDNPPDGEPFFGRIDISFDREVAESRYIGYSGIDVADSRILDWRTPLAEVYYSGAGVGKVSSYEAPRGVLQVRLTLRRRFKNVAQIISTEHESLPFYGDVQQDAEQLFADYLEEMLARYTDGLMRDIVRTIDEEQNEAIRTDKPCIVVVGRPGTGKTSVALHRIAYLNYKRQQESRGGRRTSHFAYISPTVRLCTYTSGVFRNIPDTFPEYWSVDSLMTEIIKAHHRHFSSRRLPSIQAGITIGIGCQDYMQAESALQGVQQLHSSPLIGELVYLLKLSAFLRVKTIVETTGRERFEEFSRAVESINTHLGSIRNRLTLRKDEPNVNPCIKAAEASIDRLSSILRFCKTILSITSGVHNTTIDLSGVEASSLLCQGKLLREFAQTFNTLREKYPFWEVTREDVSYDDQLRDYIPSLQKILETLNPVQLFRKVWSDPQVWNFVQQKFGEDALSYLQALAERPINEVFHDEKPLLCLFMHSVFKMDQTPLDKYAAIAIDEVQNLPYSLLLCIRRMAPQGCDIILMADPDQRTSLLGSDTAQVARLFGTTEYRLTRVYRSNPHILIAARALLNTQEPIVLVRREGLKPELYESPDENLATLAKHLLDTKGYTNVAIITKCLEDAKALGQRVNLPVVSEDKAEILRGAFIIPLSLCAGLEFDAVIVWNAADEQYAPDSEEDKRKLYVASTRAMHQLIFHKYPNTPSTLVDALVSRQLVVQASP
jgi:DNA helicase-2/ATP-dependent DNA helicase PcrA